MDCTIIAKKLKMKPTKQNLRLIKDVFEFVEFKPIPMTVQEFNEQQKQVYLDDYRKWKTKDGIYSDQKPILRDYLFNVGYHSEYNKCKPRKIGYVVTMNKKFNYKHIFYATKKLLNKRMNKCIGRYNANTNYHYYGSL